MIYSQANDQMEKLILQKTEKKTPLFPWTRSRAAGLYAIAMILCSVTMEYVVVKYACYFTGGYDPHFYQLIKDGWNKTNFSEKSFEKSCESYDELMQFDCANITNTLYGMTRWPLSNYLADSYLYASPALVLSFALVVMMFAHRHYPTVDAQGERYWGNSIIFVLMSIVSLGILVMAFVTDGHNKNFPRYIVDQQNYQIHLKAALLTMAGFAAYGIIMTIALLVDVIIRNTVKSSVAIWTIIIYGGICNIAAAYFFYRTYHELGRHDANGNPVHKYAFEWLFLNTSYMYFLTIPMLTMWAEPTAN